MEIDPTSTRLFSVHSLSSVGDTNFLRAWGEAENDFPRHFKRALAGMGWQDLSLILAIPSYETLVHDHPVKLDLFALAKAKNELVAMVIAAAIPPPVVGIDLSRLFGKPIENAHLSLAAAAVLEADRFGTAQALLLAHCFAEDRAWHDSFTSFEHALRENPVSFGPFELHLGWIQAEDDYPT